MGLFYKREQSDTSIPINISYGLEKTKLIVGLGNPGAQYNTTRHNVGFSVVDLLVEAENSSWSDKKSFKALLADIRIGTTRLLVLKPTTYMNLSGEAVFATQQYFKVSNQDTIIVHDELDIPFGQIRTKYGGGAAGHNGIKSIIDLCGQDFGRIRIGIGPKKPDEIDSADFVLQKFSAEEQKNLKAIKSEAVSIINEAAFGGTLLAETRKILP